MQNKKASPLNSPDWAFLRRHPVHLLAFGFGTGLSPKAPGTVGTLVGFPLFFLLMPLPLTAQLLLLALLFVVGVGVCEQTGRALGVADYGGIVWDEVVAFALVLAFVPASWLWWGLAFGAFRLFDIVKPFPIRQLEARIKGGFGVMLDDMLAAGYSIALLQLLQWVMYG